MLRPSDQRIEATTFASNVVINAQSTGQIPFNSNKNISYFVGLEADETHPQCFLSGDRNMIDATAVPPTTTASAQITSLGTNHFTTPFPGVERYYTNTMHNLQGNVALEWQRSAVQFLTLERGVAEHGPLQQHHGVSGRQQLTSRTRVVFVSLKRYQSMSPGVPKVPGWRAPVGAAAVPAAAQVFGRSVVLLNVYVAIRCRSPAMTGTAVGPQTAIRPAREVPQPLADRGRGWSASPSPWNRRSPWSPARPPSTRRPSVGIRGR